MAEWLFSPKLRMAGQILEANGITTTDKDLVIALQRFAFVNDRMPPITERIVSIHERKAA
jgi:hypothetical protein